MSASQQLFVSYATSAPPSGSWILTTGFWDDAGVWDDASTWID